MHKVAILSLLLPLAGGCQGGSAPTNAPGVETNARGQSASPPSVSKTSLSRWVCSQRDRTHRFNHAEFIDDYGGQDPAPLWEILTDPNRAHCWGWTLTAGAWLGGDDAVTHIAEFIVREGKQTRLEPNDRRTIARRAILALGIAASTAARPSRHTALTSAGEGRAIELLIAATDPAWWVQYPGWLAADDEANRFSRARAAALAIVWSGQDEAEDALRGFNARLKMDTSPRGQDRVKLIPPTLTRILGTVRNEGLLKVLMDEYAR